MNFPDYFADAESGFSEAEFVLVGVPFDKTSSFRKGAALAPNEIRRASWNLESYNIINDVDFTEIKVHDYGNIDIIDESSEEMLEKVTKFTKKLLESKKFPVFIGGEHSITSGILKAFPRDISVLVLDAHIDFRQSYIDNIFNHACVVRRISDHIDINNIAVIGVRSADKEEYEAAKSKKLFFIDSFSFKNQGVKNVISQIDKKLNSSRVYLSLDIDVIDPAYAPGTSTPEPFGLNPVEILKIIEHFSSRLIGCDVTEVCPPYDHGQTALLAAKFIRYIIENQWIKKGLV